MTSATNFIWYELLSDDVPAAKDFYARVVGWRTEDSVMPHTTYTVLHAADAMVGGMMAMPADAVAAGMQQNWVGYMYAPDTDAAAIRVTELGGRVLRARADIPDVGRFAVVADPQGAIFQLFTPSQQGDRPSSALPGHIGWHELHTSDWAKALEFYGELCGWQPGERKNMGDMGSYQLFSSEGDQAGAMMNSPLANTAPFWLYYFNVDDIDAASGRIGAAGGKIRHGPAPVPGERWITQATDPQGVWFALLGPKLKK